MRTPAPIFAVEYEDMGSNVFVAVRSPGGTLLHRAPARDESDAQEKIGRLMVRLGSAPEGNAKGVIERFFGIGWEEVP